MSNSIALLTSVIIMFFLLIQYFLHLIGTAILKQNVPKFFHQLLINVRQELLFVSLGK